jgi:hypothetical protein
MKAILFAFTCGVALSVRGQTPFGGGSPQTSEVPQAATRGKVKIKYDRLADTTNVRGADVWSEGKGHFLGASQPNVWMHPEYVYAGQAVRMKPDSVLLVVNLSTSGETHSVARNLSHAEEVSELKLLINDSTRITLRARLNDTDVSYVIGDQSVGRTLYTAHISTALLSQLAHARLVVGRIGSADFEYKANQLLMWNDFLAVVQ